MGFKLKFSLDEAPLIEYIGFYYIIEPLLFQEFFIMSEHTIDGQIIKSERFSSLDKHSFNGCTFNNCDFSESILRNTKFSSCLFSNCNFSLVKLDGCRLQDVKFSDCKIIGAEFFKCERTFFSANFKNCLLQYCNFSDLNMKHSSFDGSKLKDSHFTNTILKDSNFRDVDLSGTIFHNCDLSHADFSCATHYDIDPRTNKIRKAKFSFPEAVGLLRAFDVSII